MRLSRTHRIICSLLHAYSHGAKTIMISEQMHQWGEWKGLLQQGNTIYTWLLHFKRIHSLHGIDGLLQKTLISWCILLIINLLILLSQILWFQAACQEAVWSTLLWAMRSRVTTWCYFTPHPSVMSAFISCISHTISVHGEPNALLE